MKKATKKNLTIAGIIMFIGGAGASFLMGEGVFEIICNGIALAGFTVAFFLAGYDAAKKDLS